MTQDTVLELGRDAMFMTLLVSAPMLLSGMVVGLIISVFQSVTQIQEITLTFVPKIIVVMVAFLVFMPWMMSLLLTYVQPIFGGFAEIVK